MRLKVLLAVPMMWLLTSCSSSKIAFTPSSVVPAASGKIKVKTDKNKNHSIQVDVVNLASPENLSPPARFYVVWMETPSAAPKNIGQIVSSSGFLSKANKASLKTSSSFRPSRVFITAEDDAAITHPLGQTVLTTANF